MVYKQAVTIDTTMQEIPKASKPVRNASVKRTDAAAALMHCFVSCFWKWYCSAFVLWTCVMSCRHVRFYRAPLPVLLARTTWLLWSPEYRPGYDKAYPENGYIASLKPFLATFLVVRGSWSPTLLRWPDHVSCFLCRNPPVTSHICACRAKIMP